MLAALSLPGNVAVIISNAFSLNMLNRSCRIDAERIDLQQARALSASARSAVGHAETAAVFTNLLGHPVAHHRQSLTWDGTEPMLVGQYQGPRLPEGATSLPDGAVIVWWLLRAVDRTAEFGKQPRGSA